MSDRWIIGSLLAILFFSICGLAWHVFDMVKIELESDDIDREEENLNERRS